MMLWIGIGIGLAIPFVVRLIRYVYYELRHDTLPLDKARTESWIKDGHL